MEKKLLEILQEYQSLGISSQIDYDKFYLYSIITHSTAIEGSTVTEIENQLLFDEGISAGERPMVEQLMNLDLKAAYDESLKLARAGTEISIPMLCSLSALVLKNTGSKYNTIQGTFDSSKGELRKLNVTAGVGGRSYLSFTKVRQYLEKFCDEVNDKVGQIRENGNVFEQYLLSFDAHYGLVTIHPWADGNGRMSRLLMNYLQFVFGIIPTRIDKKRKSEYIEALARSREQESLEPFRTFMMEEHIRNLRTEIDTFKSSIDRPPILEDYGQWRYGEKT